MNKKILVKIIVILIIFIALIAVFSFQKNNKIYLYSWERFDDLSFLENSPLNDEVTIIPLAGEINIYEDSFYKNYRMHQIIIPDSVESFPIIRINNFASAEIFLEHFNEIEDFILSICSGHDHCQLDFDARESEYNNYINLINNIKNKLPKTEISITAPASWCYPKSWINNLPISYAVPMIYRLGKDEKIIKDGDVSPLFLSNPLCSNNIALSNDELDFNFKKYTENKNIYLFNSEHWNTYNFNGIINKIRN